MKKIIFIISFLFFNYISYSQVIQLEKYSENGEIKILRPGVTNWQKIEGQYKLEKGINFQTSTNTCAIFLLKKDVSFYLRENTIINLQDISITNSKVKISLQLLNGAIEIKNRFINKYEILIDTILSKIHINSHHLLIKNIQNNNYISSFDGSCIVIVKESTNVVNEGYGIEILPDKKTYTSFPLPDPPIPEYPSDKSIISPGINLRWNKINDAILYRIEIAKDKNFINMVADDEKNIRMFSTEELVPGKYYWRVSCINRKNLEGPFFDINSFIIQKNSSSSLTITSKKKDKSSEVKISKIKIIDDEDEDEEIVPEENQAGSVILGALFIVSLVILIII